MPAGELEINLYDAYTKWGLSLEDGALDALMTIPPAKEYITNESRLENGTRISSPSPNVGQRDITIEVHMRASSTSDFLTHLDDFMSVLRQGQVNIRTRRQRTTCYKCKYVSCPQFNQIDRRIAKFTLKLVEPNPTDRLYTNQSGQLYQNTEIGANAPVTT